ncbi:MAG TPA: DUF4231 domain-containing protein [Acidimicrobiia bacterium]|nr:DUF4231 domain-containing protein [Acidimicrobiia bacterium]
MTTSSLQYDDLPVTFRVTDNEAGRAETRFTNLVRGEIVLPLVGVAAGVGAIWVSELGVITVVAVAIVVLLRVLHRSTSSDSRWYELRAAAENIKSVAWLYSVRSGPFDATGQNEEDAERLFLSRLDAATAELSVPPPVEAGDEITPAMRRLRDAPVDDQRAAYLDGRLQDQLSWYSTAQRRNASAAVRFEVLHLVIAAFTVVVGALVVTGVDIAPALTVGSGASGPAVAWADVRRYRALSRTYAQTARKLTLLRSRARLEDTPEEWVTFVDDVEATVDAEHAQWRAARS